VIRFSIEGNCSGVTWANVFWVRNGRGQTPGLTDLQAWASGVLNAYKQQFLPHFHAGVNVNLLQCIYYGPTGGDLGTEVSSPGTGTGGGGGLPNNVAQGVSWHIQQRYRGGHPRTYFPACGDVALQDSRLWLPSQTSAMVTAANTFHSDINSDVHGNLSDLHLGTVSFVQRGEWRSPPVFRDYTLGAATMDARIDTMRRRLGRDIV